MPATKKPPTDPTKRRRRLKFRSDLIPWLSKRKDVVKEEDEDDPLKWDKTEAEEAERNRWPAVFAIAAVIGLGAGLAYTFTRPSEEDTGEVEPDRSPAIFKATNERLAQDCLEGFHAAETVQEKLEFVAWPERVEDRMHDFYGRNPDELPGLDNFRFISSGPSFKTDKTFYLATAEQGDNLSFYILLHEGDSIKIDWECLVGYGPVGFDDFIENPPADAVPFRLMAAQSDYNNYDFSDSNRFKAYELTTLESERRIHGYVEIGSEVHNQMEDALFKRSSAVPLRVLLAPPSSGGRPACKIERLIKPHWSGE